MLMPGGAGASVMKVTMGALDDIPDTGALCAGAAEVEVLGLATGGGSVEYTFDANDSSFTSPRERLTAGRLVEIVEGEGEEGDSVAFVLVKKEQQ